MAESEVIAALVRDIENIKSDNLNIRELLRANTEMTKKTNDDVKEMLDIFKGSKFTISLFKWLGSTALGIAAVYALLPAKFHW